MKRDDFLKTLALLPAGAAAMKLMGLKQVTDQFPVSKKYPVLFIGHGHPMNALFDNDFTQTLTRLGSQLERPSAVLVISAHWETVGTFVSTNPSPRTIYDFGGFDKKLYEIKYEPAGAPDKARELLKSIKSTVVKEDVGMGLDHGAWTVLKFIFPKADIPVFEMSIDYTKPPAYHYALGQELQSLREKGVLVLCSGNIVHNLRLLNWQDIQGKPADWGVEFDELVKKNIDAKSYRHLVEYDKLGNAARMAVPTNDHYLPMLYSLGLAGKDEQVKYLYEGFQYGSISMRCFQVG